MRGVYAKLEFEGVCLRGSRVVVSCASLAQFGFEHVRALSCVLCAVCGLVGLLDPSTATRPIQVGTL